MAFLRHFKQMRLVFHDLTQVQQLSIHGSPLSSRCITQNTPYIVNVAEIHKDGKTIEKSLIIPDFVNLLKENEFRLDLPLRDLRIFFTPIVNLSRLPAILPRPTSQCYFLELEHIKLICLRGKCFVLNPRNNIVKDFVKELEDSCNVPPSVIGGNGHSDSVNAYINMLTHASNRSDMAFEHVVLEKALANVTNKLQRHLILTKPALDMLLEQISQDPSTPMIRRLLAFRKSLGEFERTVADVRSALTNLLGNDEDMIGLYLTDTTRDIHHHEDVELLLEAYNADLIEIQGEIRSMKEMVEETNQFMNTHLDSVRNKLIRMQLFMEMGTLGLGSGAVTAGVFGMNLTSGLESHPTAFYMACGGIMCLFGGIFGVCASRYRGLMVDTSSAQSFKALKYFFRYVDELDQIVMSRGSSSFSKAEFKEILDKITATNVSEEEADFIFRMFDTDKDGRLNRDEILLRNDPPRKS